MILEKSAIPLGVRPDPSDGHDPQFDKLWVATVRSPSQSSSIKRDADAERNVSVRLQLK
jgi:hypothetical protein